ncbi:hypothetical protein C8R47DRAFT_1108687 [Mycena vitilis]|nr:hypothetical protein C8R47DRAFT_1108687 [Mycena vitilis]
MTMGAPPFNGPDPWNHDPLHPLYNSPVAQTTRPDFSDLIVHRNIQRGRQRRSSACDTCSSRKVKCSGDQPSCKRCLVDTVDCAYTKKRRRGSAKPKANSTASAFKDLQPSPYSRSVNSNEYEGMPGDSPLLQTRLSLPSPVVGTLYRAHHTMPVSSSARFSSQFTRHEGHADSDTDMSVSRDSPRSSCDSPFFAPPPFLPPGLHWYVYSQDENETHTRRRYDEGTSPQDELQWYYDYWNVTPASASTANGTVR